MISEFTLKAAKGAIEVRFLDSLKVKGKQQPVKIYELLGRKDNGFPDVRMTVKPLARPGPLDWDDQELHGRGTLVGSEDQQTERSSEIQCTLRHTGPALCNEPGQSQRHYP